MWDGSRRNQNISTPGRHRAVVKAGAGKVVKKAETEDRLGAETISAGDFNLLLSRMTSLKSSMIALLGLLLVSPVAIAGTIAIAGTAAIAQGRTLYLDYCAS